MSNQTTSQLRAEAMGDRPKPRSRSWLILLVSNSFEWRTEQSRKQSSVGDRGLIGGVFPHLVNFN